MIDVRWRVGRELRRRGYDRALVLPRSFKSALVPFFAAIPERVGYRGEMRYGVLTEVRALDEQRLTRTVQRFVALGLEGDARQPPTVAQDAASSGLTPIRAEEETARLSRPPRWHNSSA